jgi:hypothetical protein
MASTTTEPTATIAVAATVTGNNDTSIYDYEYYELQDYDDIVGKKMFLLYLNSVIFEVIASA